MPDRLHMIFQRLPVDRKSFQDQIWFPEGQRIAFDCVRVIGVFDRKLFIQPFQFSLCQRTLRVQLFFLPVDTGKDAFPGPVPAVSRLVRIRWDLPAPAFLKSAGDPALGAKDADASFLDPPPFGSLFYCHGH